MKKEETRMEQVPQEGFHILCTAGEIEVRLIEKGQNYAPTLPFMRNLFTIPMLPYPILSKDAKAEETLVPLGSRDKKLDGSVRKNK